eukprot:8735591-Pyramimonas_sp.AAC.1
MPPHILARQYGNAPAHQDLKEPPRAPSGPGGEPPPPGQAGYQGQWYFPPRPRRVPRQGLPDGTRRPP